MSVKKLTKEGFAKFVAALIEQAIEETGAAGRGGLGLVMKTIMPKVKGRADGNAVKQMVQARLAEPAEE